MNYEEDDDLYAWWAFLDEVDRKKKKAAAKPVPDRGTVVNGLLRGMAELQLAREAA